MKTIKSVSLYFKEGSSDKVYKATIEGDEASGYSVNFAYGRRGASMNTGTKTSSPVELKKAEIVHEKLVNEKKKKGYQVFDDNEEGIPTVLPNTKTDAMCVLLNAIEEEAAYILLSNDNWYAQEKFDGTRLTLKKNENKITGYNRKGNVVSVPHVIQKGFAPLDNCTVDGELIGETYYVFDILSYKGESVQDKSVKSRIAILKKMFVNHAIISIGKDEEVFGLSENVIFVDVAASTEQKKKLWEEIKRDNGEGIVLKHRSAFYTVGRPASGGNYLKHKFYKTCSCIVTVTNQKRSVGIGLYAGGTEYEPVGNVSIPANFDVPKINDIVEVRYLYAFVGGSLFQPTFLGVRNDIESRDCRIEQLVYKQNNDEE